MAHADHLLSVQRGLLVERGAVDGVGSHVAHGAEQVQLHLCEGFGE
jgi:hypothetical protein